MQSTLTPTVSEPNAPLDPLRNPLIGRAVWFFRWDWDKPLEPRAGIINGINHDGTPNVTVFHDHTLDQFNRSMLPVMSYAGVPLVAERPVKCGLGKHVCMLSDGYERTVFLVDPKTNEVKDTINIQTPPAASRK